MNIDELDSQIAELDRQIAEEESRLNATMQGMDSSTPTEKPVEEMSLDELDAEIARLEGRNASAPAYSPQIETPSPVQSAMQEPTPPQRLRMGEVVASAGEMPTADDFRGAESMGGATEGALRAQERYGTIAAPDDGSVGNWATNAFTTFSQGGTGRIASTDIASKTAQVAEGFKEGEGGRKIPFTQLSDDELDDYMNSVAPNGFFSYIGNAVGLGGRNKLMKEWDETQGVKFTDPVAKKNARVRYAMDVARNILGVDAQLKGSAKAELEGRDKQWQSRLVSGGLDMLGYMSPRLANIVGGPWAGRILSGAVEATARRNELLGPRFVTDENGDVRYAGEGDTRNAALAKGALRGGVMVAVEDYLGSLAGKGVGKLTGATLGKFPILQKVGDAVVDSAVGKKLASYTKGFNKLFGSIGLNTLPVEVGEELVDQIFDAGLGLDRAESEKQGTTAWSRTKDSVAQFMKPENLLDLVESMALVQILGGGAATYGNWRSSRNADALLERVAGVDKSKLKDFTADEKWAAYEAYVNGLSEKEVQEKLGRGAKAVNALADTIRKDAAWLEDFRNSAMAMYDNAGERRRYAAENDRMAATEEAQRREAGEDFYQGSAIRRNIDRLNRADELRQQEPEQRARNDEQERYNAQMLAREMGRQPDSEAMMLAEQEKYPRISPTQTTQQEISDETRNGSKEAPAQPEQAQSVAPPSGEAARPVAEESERSETSEVVEKPVSSRSVIEKMTDKAPVQELPVSEVFNDDVRIPNFKEGANPETGEVEPLTGEPYDLVSNPIVVMEFKDGKKVVVTGRHRLALYKRSGRDKIAARVIREADGWTVNDAKMIDSIGNIIDEKGSVKDYVRYFEDAKPSREAAEAGGFLARAKGKLAFGIYESATEDTRSSIDWEGSGADGMISVEQAGIIAEAAPKNGHPRNKALQRILVAKALNGLRGKKLGILARSLAEEVKRQKNIGEVGGAMQLELFSSAEDQALLAMEDKRADYRAKKAREYGKIAEDLRTALRKGGRLDINKNYAKELGITDPKDKKQIAAARDKAVQKANYWENAVRLDDADKVAMDAELGFSPIAETPAKKSGDSPSVADNKPNTTKKPQETTVQRTEAAGRENTRPNAKTRPEAVSGANAGRSGSDVRKVNPTAPNFKRGERVFLKGTTSKQTVTFLKANADGTVDVQVRTPGANRYAPTTAETRTVPAADVSATGLKDTLSASEKEALKRGMEGESDEQWINGQKGALTERGRKILDYVNSIVGKTFERKGADGSRTVEKVLRITPKGNVRLLQNIWEADGTQSVKDREYTQFASQARYNQDGWQEVEDKVSFMSDEFSPNARREYDEVYNRYHNTDGTRKRGWMRAPSGKPTKLTERQWVQVRTPSFKKWFGDWEANAVRATWYDIEDPDVIRNLIAQDVRGIAPITDKSGIQSMFRSFGKVTNKTDKRTVEFPSNSAGRMVYVRNLVGAFKTLFEQSRRAWSEPDDGRHPNIAAVHHYVAKANTKDGEVFVHFTVREDNTSGNNIHAATVTSVDVYKTSGNADGEIDRNEAAHSVRDLPYGKITDNKIAYFLSGVNPGDVSKVVDENGEPLVVYHDTNSKRYVNRETGEDWDLLTPEQRDEWEDRDDWDDYWEEQDFWTFDNRNSRNGIEMPAHFFSPTPDPYHEYGERRIAAFLNIRNPAIDPVIPHRERDTAGADAMNALRTQGHDGFIRTEDGKVIEINAFDPNQIKSATDNTGAFDGTNADIRFMSDEFDEDAELEGKFDPETASLFVRPPINLEEVRTPSNPLVQVVPPKEGSVAQAVDKEIAEDEARVARSRGTPRGIPPPPAPGSQSNPTLDPGYEPESIGAGVADPISRQEIVDKFRELFGDEVAIRGANTTRIGKNYAGHYEPDTGIIRTKNPVSLRTIPHELGHYIEDVAKRTGVLRMNSVRRDLEALGKELYGDKKPPNGYESEGVAELVKYYLQGNDAGLRSRHIAAYHWLVIDFGKKNPDVMERLDALRDMIDRLQNQSGDDAVRGIRTKGGSFSKQPSLAERAEKLVTDAIEGTKKALTPTAENWIDQGAFIMKGMRASGLDKLMDWQKALKDGDTAKMNDIIENHPALKYKLYNGKAAARAYQALEKGVTDLSGTRRYTYGDLGVDTPGHNANELIPTFKEIFGDFTASEMDEFENYAIARIAKEAYLDKGLEFGLTKKEVMPTIIKYSRNTKFQNALDRYTHYKHAVLHLLVDSGAMSQEQFEQIVAANPIYVRITRRHDDADLFRKRMQQKRGKAVNRRTGSGRQVEDIFDAGLVNDERIFAAAFQADLLRSLINLGKRGEKAGGVAEGLSVGANWLREVPNAQGAVTFTAEKLRKQITEAMQNAAVADGKADADNIFDQLFSDGKDTLTIFKEKPSNGKNGLVSLYDEDGKLHTYELPQNNAEGWAKGLMGFTDASKPNILEQWAQMAAAATRAGATVLNPTFAVRNIVRDTLHASVVNEYGSYIPGVSTVEGVVMDLFGSKAKDIFDAMGIPMGSLLGEAKLTSAKRANRYLMSRNWFEAQWNKGVKKAIADVVGFSENATRVKEFQLVRDYMLKNGASEKAANMLAAANALDITIDFQRGGETTKRLNRIIPFLNAAVQGLEQTARAFGIAKAQPWQLQTSRRRRLARTVIQGGAWLMSLAIASMLYNYSDDERRRKYRELKPHEKWNYFDFGDFRLPVPYEFGYIFASIPSAVVAEMSGDKGAVAECLGMMKKSLPGFSPTDIAGLGPLLSAAMNESWTGAAIVPEHIMRTKESYDWYDSRTSEFSKRLAKAFHKFFGNGEMASPAHIDYVLNAWTGNMFSRTIGSIGKQSAFDASRPNTYPIFGTFFRNPATSSRVVGDFHERRLDLTRRKGSDNISDEELKELERRNVVAKTLTELRKESQAVRNDPLLSAKERNDRLEKLAEQSRAAVKTLSEDYRGNDPVVKETAYKLVKKEFETAKKELDSVRKDNTLGWKAKNARIAQMRNANALLNPNVEDRIQGLISEERKTLAQVKFWQDMLKYLDNTPNTPKKDRQSALSNIAKLEAVAGRLRDDVMKIAREAAPKPSSGDRALP